MNRISVCIPTYKRLGFLKLAIQSCLKQSRLPDEVIVSDDDDDLSALRLCEELRSTTVVPIRHVANLRRPKGLANNVNNSFMAAQSDLLVLLHDDDELLPRCLELLEPAFANPGTVAAYGKQLVMNEAGEVDQTLSETTNRIYSRESKHRGIQKDAILAGAMQQFPNIGYMIRSQVAQKVLHQDQYGGASEVDFGIRCGHEGAFEFIDEYTAKYRILSTMPSLSNRNNDDSSYHKTKMLLDICEKYPDLAPQLQRRIVDGLPAAIIQAARIGQKKDALAWYFSWGHLKSIPSLGGIRRLIEIARP